MKFKKLFIYIMSFIFLATPYCYGFSAYSNSELDELEKQFKQTINLSPMVIRNPLAKTYINQLAEKLARNGQMDTPYFFIVNSPEINAFAGPGGYIGVNSQLILASDNESELAAVMAHEMAHVRLHHLYRMIEHQKQMKIPQLAGLLAAAALGVINPVLGSSALMGAMSGFQQDSINFVRSNEKEADNIGMSILSKAQFNPHGMPSFFKKMQENMRYYYTDNIPAILRTHPLDEDRIAEAENRIAQLPTEHYQSSSKEYHLFKELIRHEVKHDAQKQLEYYQKSCPKISPSYACNYGLALTYLELNKMQQAKALLEPLDQNPEFSHNPYISLALANAEQNLGNKTDAQSIYQKFYSESPNNSALVSQYSEFLDTENNPKQALSVLVKAHRKMKQDLNICLKLARVQAKLKMTAEAYFTEANCHLIRGETRAALEQLNVAKRYTKSSGYMYQRITAKIDEVKDAIADEKS
jgi:Zn-dependent protease with chaperone function